MNSNTYTNRTAKLFSRWMMATLLTMGILSTNVANAQVSVTATAGTAGPTSYTTVSAAFAAINAGTHQGAVTIRITANTTEPGSPTALLKSASPSNYTSVLITPFGGNYTIGGTITANRGIIELSGADNVTIDGDDPTITGKRNLTIGFSTTAATIASCIRVNSNSTLGSDGASNNTVKNCIITGNRASAGTTATYGINMGNYSTTSSSTGGYSSLNNRFENNLITRCYHGIWAVGASATYPNTGLQIVNNVLGDGTVAGNIGNRGIIMSYSATTESQSAVVSGNEVVGVGDPGTTGYAASIAGMEFGTVNFGAKIFNNYIHDVKQPSTSGYGAYGVLFSGATSCDSTRFYNNIITRITASNYTTSALSSFTNYGIKMTAGTTFGDFSNNTIVLNTANPTGTTTNPLSYAMSCDVNGVRIVNFRNNIIVNTIASTNAVGIYVNNNATFNASNYAGGQIWDRNCYWVPTGALGYSAASTPQTTFSAWKTATGKDGTSFNLNPSFVSSTDLHIDGTVASLLESGGMTTSFNTDFDGQTRPGPSGSTRGGATGFDIGADEFDGIPIVPVSITSASATANSCTAIAHTVTATVVQGTNATTSVTLSYTLNGTAQTPISMTNTSGNTWTATIPAATPTNATIAWTVTAVDAVASPTSSGSYQDDALYGIGSVAAANPTSVCTGTNTSLSVSFYNPLAAPTNYTIQAVTNPTTDEDLGNVTITAAATSTVLLNNTSTYNSLVGTLGTATGTAGSYASYLGFGSISMTAGSTYNFSVSSLQGATAYGNSMAIYIDLNRDGDFADAGENLYVAAATTLGAHTETGSFVIPTTANNGLTRMRVMINEGLITGPTMAISYGEREEYLVNLVTSNNGGGGNIPSFTYNWSDGSTSVGTTSPLSTAVAANTTYTVTSSTVAGCTIAASVAVSAIALPTAPTATNSTQCGPGASTASVASNTGLSSPTFRWYAASTGGSSLQSSTTATYGTSISATTTLYVSEFDGTCESVRTPVTVTVNTPPSITTSGPATICSGKSTTMFVLSSNPGYSYSWSGGAGTGASVSVSPLTTTTYTVTALDTTTGANSGCTITGTNTITVNASPIAVTITASPAAVCQGASSTLTTSGGYNSGTYISGGLTTVNSTTGYPAPFTNYYGGTKTQWMYTAAELTALGFAAGDKITSMGLAVSAVGSTFTGTLNNFTIGMKNAGTLSALTATFETGMTSLGSLNWSVPTTGLPIWTVVTFPSPFVWTGGALVVETSYSNANSGSSTDFVQTYLTNTGSNYCGYYRVDGATAATVLAATAATLTTNRPDTRFGWQRDGVWSWSPVSSSLSTISVNPSTSTTYTATATNGAGCTASGSATVTVNPNPTISASTTDVACFGQSTGTISASAANGTSPFTFALNGTNSNSTGAYTALAAGTYVVSTTDANGCTATTSKTITQPASACTLSATGSNPACNGGSDGSVSFSTTGGTAPYSFTLNGTAATSPVTGLAAGSYVVVSTDANGCVASSTVTLTAPAAVSASIASTTNVSCNGGSNGAATASASGGTGTLSYAWSSGETVAAISGKSAGAYVVTVTDANNCSATATATITEPSVLTATATPLSATVCGASATTSVTVAAAGGTAPYTGEGSFTQGANTTSYTVTDANGCSASADASVTALSYTITATAGTNGTISPAGASTVDCGATQSYTITPDAGYQVDVLTVDGSPVASSLTYNFINVTANRTIDVTFTVATCSTVPTASAPAIATICSASNYTLNGTIGGAATSGTWSTSGTGSFDNTAYGTGTIYTPSAADIAAGSVTITLTTDDPDGAGPCAAATASTVITINITPTVAIAGTTSICAGNSTTLTASGAPAYLWSDGQTTAAITVSTTGSYSVTGTAANGCSASASASVVVNALPNAPTVAASGATTFCTGGSVTLTSDYVGGNVWSNGATTDAITVAASGSYSVTYTDGNGCSATSAATAVTVNASSASISGVLGICAGGSTTLTASATPAAVSYLWSDGSTNSTLSVSVSGTYSVTTTDANGCTAVASATVIDAAPYTVSITSNCATWQVGNQAVLTATASVAGTYTYLWNNGSTNQTRNANNANSYSVTVTGAFGCTATASYTLTGAPLSGTYTVAAAAGNTCGTFNSLANVITHLNTYGVSGNVTVNLPAGFTETAPVGGFKLKMCGLAANLQSGPSQSITFQKSGAGANPVLTSYVGTSTTVDGIFIVVSADNVTIDGINLVESAANTTATTRMEWGYAVLKCSGDDGANDVAIRNTNVTLTNAYTSNFGIYLANHSDLNNTGFTNSTYATTAQAARNKVTITNNTVNNCYNGIRLGANPNVVATTGECLNDTLNNISNNTITNFGSGATSAYGIYYGNNRQITIRNNTISSSTTATSATSGGIYALSGTWATICGNTIQNIVSSSTFYGIYHALTGGDATNPNIVRIDSNIIQNCTPTAGSFYGIYGSSSGGTSAQVSTNYNEFRNHTWASTSTATMYGMYQFNSGTNMTFNCNYNLVYNNTLQNTNTFYGIYGSCTSGTYNCRYNTIRNNVLSPSSGISYIMYPSSSNETHLDYNNITNNRKVVLATATTVGTVYGIYAVSGSTLAGSINNNVIDTLYNRSVPGTLTSLIYGLYYSATMATGSTINNNIVRNISIQGVSTGNQTIYASYFAPTGTGTIIKGNRIARIGTTTSTTGISTDAQFGGAMNSFVVGAQLAGSTTAGATKLFDGNTFNTIIAGGSNGIARGIWATTGQEWNIFNNAISRINAPFANPTTAPTASSSTTVTIGTAVHGIDIANATAGNNFYLYNNSVYLTGSGGGANYATTGIHANITPNVTLVNNLVINNTASGASQAAVAYRRSGVLSATYQAASDNNLFYAGTPGATKLIYGEGVGATTNAKQTLADYKTYVSPRDASSRTENTTFTAPTTDSLLHVSTTVATFVESGGKPYPAPALTTDIDGQTRSTTAPDIGADEDNFIGLLPQIASITASPATGGCTAVYHTVTVVVGSNVTVTGVTLNYSLNGTAQTPIAMSNGGSGTSWTAVIPASGSSIVTFSATATDGTNSVSSNGTSYQDNYLNGLTLTAAVSPTTVCEGSSLNLNSYVAGSGAAPTTYANSNATSTADEELLNVTLGTLNQTSVCGAVAPGAGSIAYQYSNYTGVTPTLLVAGQTYSGSVTSGYCGTGTYSNIVSIYIDFNRDGDFADAGENAWNSAYGTKTFPSQVLPFSITVPSSVSIGLTRMRVVINESTTAPATGTYSFGETEDYTVQLGGGSGYAWSWTNGTSVIATANGAYTPAAAGTYSYTVTGTDPNGCSLTSAPVTINVSALPTAPTATNSTQCGNGIPTASVTSTSGAATPIFNWASPALNTYYTNDFASGLTSTASFATTLPVGVLSGSASVVGGLVQLTPNTTSQLGGLTIPASGVNGKSYNMAFRVGTSAAALAGADGMSYSFADDADATSTAVNAETGSGSKLKISFDTYDATGNGAAGIRVIYGSTVSNPGTTVGTNGILAYSSNTSWAGSSAGANANVEVSINDLGQLTLSLGGTALFTNVQLPSSFLTANKATWKHVFAGRTGGIAQIHSVDNITITQSSLIQQTSGTWPNSISQTTSWQVSEVNASGCESPAVTLTATVNQPVSAQAIASPTTVCPGGNVTLDVNLGGPNGYAFTWYKSAGPGSNGAIGTGTPQTVNPFLPGTYTYSVVANDAAVGCVTVSTVQVTVTAPPSILGVTSSPASICLGSSSTLTATTTTIVSGPQTDPVGYVNPSFSSTLDEEIFNVTLATLNNTSNCSSVAPGPGSVNSSYNNYTTSVAAPTLSAGQSYSGSITIGYCATNTYSNIVCMFIDYNRDGDFVDAGEKVYTKPYGASQLGGSAYPFTVTIPNTALPGITRMRVVVNESSTAPTPTQTGSWGEGEDYLVNILSFGAGAGSYAWSWSDGTSNVGTGNVITVNPTATTTYTVTATDPATGCTNSGEALVTVLPVPAVPTATNSAQCGAKIPTCSVTGDGTPGATFNWYMDAVGGTPIAGETGSTLTNYIVSTSDTLYVSQSNPGSPSCEGPRVPVIIDVTIPDAIAITASAAPYCLNGTISLSVANTAATPAQSYTYTWSASSTNAGLTTTSGSSVSPTPTAIGSYNYTVTAVDGQCQNVAIYTAQYYANPVIDSINALPAGPVCAGTQISLNAYSVGSGPQTQPTGYCTGTPSTITADEQIFGVSFASMSNLSQGETCATNYTNYTSTIPAPTVVAGASYPFTVVTNECDGATYFSNGLSIFIDWNRDGDFADAGEQAYTTTATTQSPNTRSGTITVPATASAGVTRMRVVVQESVASPTACPSFSYGEMEDYIVNVLALSNGGNTWTWAPNGATGNQVTDAPTSTTNYVVTATNAAGCTATRSVSMSVLALPSAPAAIDNTICGFNAANVSVASTTGATSPVFQWYLDATGGSAIPSQSGSTLNGYYLSAADTFYVSESNGTCLSSRTMVIQNVNQPDAITAAASVSSLCLPGVTVDLSATQTGTTNNYTYSWTAVPPVGSGLAGVQLGPITTLFSNDFTSSTLPANVTLSGSANIANGVLQVTPNTLSQSGGVKITAGGNAADTLSVGFDLIVPQNGADGVSYSYSNDGLETVQASMNSENGTGSKLKVGFVSYTNGTSTNGIYLMYNCTTNEQTPSTSGVLAYSSNVSWRGSAAPVRVTYTVGSTGLFNLALNGTPVFTDVQLPAAYVSASKSNWYHIFKGRTGGVSEEHSIDNMIVQAAQIQSVPTPGQNISVVPTVAGTYTYYVTATDGGCNTQSTVTVVANPPAAAINAGADLSLCDGGSVTLNASSAGLIPALRFTESLWQVNAGTGSTGTGIPAWCSTWYTANGGTTRDMLEITNLGAGLASSAGVTIQFWNSSSTTAPLYSYTIPSSASTMASGGLLYFSHSGTPIITDLTNNFFTNGQNLDNGSGTAGGWVMRKNGVLIDAMAVSGYTFPAASGVTSADWSGSLATNSGLSGSVLIAADNNTASSWSNTSTLVLASVGTLNSGLTANLPQLGTVNWTSIPAGFTGTQASGTFGPITQPTTFIVTFDNGTCQSSDTVVATPVTTPAVPVISSNKDSICVSGGAVYSASNITQGTSLMWQYYDHSTGLWTNTDSTRTQFNTPVFTPVNGDTTILYRLMASCGTNPVYSDADTLQIVKPFIASVVNDTVCGIGQLDLSVVGNGTMNWYTTSSSTSIVNTGLTYSTTTISNVVYWVRASVGTCLDPAGRQPVFGIVNPAPSVNTSSNVTICENLSTTMTVSSPADTNGYYTYTWTPGNVTGSSYTVTPASTTTYTVVAQSATGCGNYGLVTVTVDARPIIQTATASSSTICQGDTTTLAITLGNVNGPQTPPTGYCVSGGSTTTADEQIFSVTFGSMTNTQTEDCLNNNTDYTSTIAPVTVVAGTSVPWSVVVDECDGSPYYSNGLSIYIDYNRDGDWDDAGEQAYTTTVTTTAPVTRSGTISIPLTATLGVTRMRVVAQESVASPISCPTFSYGEVEDYLVNIIGNSGSTVWTPGNLSGLTVSVSPAATTTYTATVTAANGCTQTATVPVTVLPFTRPTITASGSTTLCTPETVTLDAGAGYDSYSWSDGTTQVATTQTYTTGTAGTYTVTVANLNGCSASVSQTVIVKSFTAPVINASKGTICTGADVSTLSLTSSYASYLWSNGATTPSITVGDTGTYTVTVTSAGGCTGSTSFTLNGSPAPIPPVINDADIINYCWDGVTAGSYLLIADGWGQSVSWNDPGGSTDEYVFLNVGSGPGEYGVGSYPIIITAQAAGGCIAADTVIFNVLATSSSTSVAAACDSYDWNGQTYTASGTYTYTMIGGNVNGCDSTATLSLTINTPTSSSSAQSACDSYDWNGQTYTASGTYTWSGTNANGCDSTATLELTINTPTSSTSTLTACDSLVWNGVTYTTSGTYTWNGTNAAGCDSVATLVLTIDNACGGSGVTLNLNLFLQGYVDLFATSPAMVPVLANQFVSGAAGTETDTVTVTLYDALSTSTIVDVAQGVLMTDGTMSVTFANASSGVDYWIGVTHRNSLETWSAAPVTFSSTTSYDFTSGLAQAYSIGLDAMVEIGTSGVYALWTGDLNQDDFIDATDFTIYDADNAAGLLFDYYATDMNGDGFVDATDFTIYDASNAVGPFFIQP